MPTRKREQVINQYWEYVGSKIMRTHGVNQQSEQGASLQAFPRKVCTTLCRYVHKRIDNQ